MSVHKYVEGEHRKRRLQQPSMSKREERREMENGRRTSFWRREVWLDQARPKARLWLRDYLGRQAGGHSNVAVERGLKKDGGASRGCR